MWTYHLSGWEGVMMRTSTPLSAAVFQGGDKFIIQDEVGCGDIDIMVRPLDEVQIGILRHIKVIQGGIGVGLHIALRRERPRGEVFFLGTIEGIAAGVQGPLLEEHTGKAAHRGAAQQHGGILPVAETASTLLMYSSARLMPPVKPTWPSMTQILRWSR